jgi:hypothetical protein
MNGDLLPMGLPEEEYLQDMKIRLMKEDIVKEVFQEIKY